MRRALPLFVLGLVAACDGAPAQLTADPGDGSAALFRDFQRAGNGKFDSAGHPTNSVVLEAEAVCDGAGKRLAKTFVAGTGQACVVALAPRAYGELMVNLKLRALPAHQGDVAVLTIVSGEGDGAVIATRTVTSAQIRKANAWTHIALPFSLTSGQTAELRVDGAGNGKLELDYVELFPAHFQLAIDPGSREYKATDELAFESALGSMLTVTVDGVDKTARLKSLLASGVAKQELTAYRRIVRVPAGALVGTLGAATQIFARTNEDAACVEVRRAAPACEFVGDPDGTKVLLTGFQPFPADGDHENVSWVGVDALDPLALPGVQVMRIELPVEYDRAAAEVVSAIERCHPDRVISFGQGSDAIHLEETAYNVKDTAELSGGVPDNRGIVFAGTPIDASPEAADTRASTLPLDAIAEALSALGESGVRSDDPGRYVCNNVFYAVAGAAAARGVPAGFVHLPYETQFPDETRARWGRVVEAIVATTAR